MPHIVPGMQQAQHKYYFIFLPFLYIELCFALSIHKDPQNQNFLSVKIDVFLVWQERKFTHSEWVVVW